MIRGLRFAGFAKPSSIRSVPETPATTVDRQCGSAQQAVNFASALIASGVHDVAIGGGVEHMGHISFADSAEVMKEHGFAFSPALMERYNLVPQGISAEMIADKWEIPRSEMDEIGLRSHQLAHQATEEGRFEREIVPVEVNGSVVTKDDGPRASSTLERIASLEALASGSPEAEQGFAVALPSLAPVLTAKQEREAKEYLSRLRETPFSPPTDRPPPPPVLAHLLQQGDAVKVSGNVIFLAEAYQEMVARTTERMRADGSLTLAEVRDMFGTSRRYAQALLEHLDEEEVTRRVGDTRVLR